MNWAAVCRREGFAVQLKHHATRMRFQPSNMPSLFRCLPLPVRANLPQVPIGVPLDSTQTANL